MTAAAVRPPIGTVHRETLEAFRQGDPEWAEYLELNKRIEIIEPQAKTQVKKDDRSENA